MTTTRQALEAARAALDDAATTLLAVRATTVSPEWAETAKHFHDLCGATVRRVNAALPAIEAALAGLDGGE